MKATKKSGTTKGKSSGKREVKDLPVNSAASVKGGAIVEWRRPGKGELQP